MFTYIHFTQQEIADFEAQPVSYRAYYDNGARWIGRVGEEAFRRWLTLEELSFTDLTGIGPSWIDFTVGNLKIDVKTVGAASAIKDTYGCNFTAEQYDKMEQAEMEYKPNCFVFMRFIASERAVAIVGVKSKKNFDKDKLERCAGVAVTDSYTPKLNTYEIQIDQCSPPQRLVEYIRARNELNV